MMRRDFADFLHEVSRDAIEFVDASGTYAHTRC